jgi:hypothetical protein
VDLCEARASRMSHRAKCKASAGFRSGADRARAPSRCRDDPDDSWPCLAAGLGWFRVLRCLRFLLFKGTWHGAISSCPSSGSSLPSFPSVQGWFAPGRISRERFGEERVHAVGLSWEQKVTEETKRMVDQKSAGRARAASRCRVDPDDSWPGLAAALGWVRVLRCLRFLLFKGGLHRAGSAARFRQPA